MCRVNSPTHPAVDAAASATSTPSPAVSVPRRSVLRGGLAFGVGALALSTITACQSGPTQAQTTAQALLPLATAATAESERARALAPQIPAYTAALGVIADQRAEHARALREEITRLDQEVADSIDASPDSPSAPATPTTPPAVDAGATVDPLRDELMRSTRTAYEAAIALEGYSAGLAGSIAACLTTMTEVQLA